MNIFVLSLNVIFCARYHCDKHVVKMILETAQILCTCHRFFESSIENLYKSTHIGHPSCKWVRESSANYEWLFDLFIALCHEYTYRYQKQHLCFIKFSEILKECPKNMPKNSKMTPFRLAMPVYCIINYANDVIKNNAVDSYRNYYKLEKKHIAKWTKRPIPNFYKP